MFSATLAPLNSIVSKPSWPSRVSLSSPGFQTNVSSPAPIRAVSLPSPPLIRSSPSLPMSDVVAEAAVHRELDAVGLAATTALMTSSPPRALSVSRSLACSWKKMLTRGLQAEDVDPAGVAGGAEHVGAVGAVDRDRVGRAVAAAVRARAGRGRSRVTSVPLRSPTTMLSAPPSARKSIVSTSSRSIVTLATSRRKSDAAAVGRRCRCSRWRWSRRTASCRRRPGPRSCRCRRPDPTGTRRRRRPGSADVVAVVAEDEVVAVAAEEHVGALASRGSCRRRRRRRSSA